MQVPRYSFLARLGLTCALLSGFAIAMAQEIKEIPLDKSLPNAAGQPQCASFANTMGVINYKNAMLAKKERIPLARMLEGLTLEPSAYQEWDRGMPDLYRTYWDRLWANKYKNMQEAVEDLYAMCMDSSVARERDRRFKKG